MAAWYVSSVGWTAVTAWAATTAYSVGDLRRQLATPAVDSERVFRCTTAGTSGGSEPTWNLSKGATTNDGTAVWTEVTGNSTYNWAAPHARLKSAAATWAAAGDTVYVAHNHAETTSAAISITTVGSAASPLLILCVTSAGSVPPVSADLRTTATITTTGASNITIAGIFYMYGITFSCADGANNGTLTLGNSVGQRMYLDSCALKIAGTGASGAIRLGTAADTQMGIWLENTTLTFSATGQGITSGSNVTWRNTPSALGGATFPTTLIKGTSTTTRTLLDGVDLSALGSGKTIVGEFSDLGPVRIVNCKLGGSVTIATTPTTLTRGPTYLTISDSADTHNRQEIYHYLGTLTTETTIVRSSGASDGDTSISWKVATTANSAWTKPFETFQIAVWNTSVGSSKTATIEIVNDGTTLKDSDIWMDVQYLGTSGVPLASTASSRSADVLNAGTNLTTSSVTWNTTGLSSPVKQYMQVTFTPQEIGYIRATVYVAIASKTIYIDPVLTIA